MDHTKFVLDKNGNEILWEAAAYMMDDDIRETLHFKLAPCDNQTFFDAYIKMHKAKFNEDFTV